MSFWRFTSLLIARVSVSTLGAGAWGGQRHQVPLELGLGENELFDLSSGNQTQGPVQMWHIWPSDPSSKVYIKSFYIKLRIINFLPTDSQSHNSYVFG